MFNPVIAALAPLMPLVLTVGLSGAILAAVVILLAWRYNSAPGYHRLDSVTNPYRPTRSPELIQRGSAPTLYATADDVLGRAMAFEYEDLSGAFDDDTVVMAAAR